MGRVVTAYIGMGSNLSHPRQQIERALEALASVPATRLMDQSSLYRSEPMGPIDQPDFINAVAKLETQLSPYDLLTALQEIENSQGRVRTNERWGPRTLDLDLLLYSDQVIADDRLVVPHSGLGERNFVLYPLHEIAGGELEIPGLGMLSQLLQDCPQNGLELVDIC